MKVYKVKVNGKLYEVELEEVKESNDTINKVEKPVSLENNSNAVKAPISGKVLDVKVNLNDKVKKGQTLLVIEAMKLENEVVSPSDGVVKNILVSKGSNVNNKDDLIILG